MSQHYPINNSSEPYHSGENHPSDSSGGIQLGSHARYPSWLGYVVTLLVEILVTAGLVFIEPYLPLGVYPIPYVLVIMLIAHLFGGGPAILAFFVGFLAYDYFFVPPLHTVLPHQTTPAGWASIIAYLMGVSIVGFATVLMRKSRQRVLQITENLLASEEALQKVNRTLRMLSQVNQVIIRASEEPALLKDVCQIIVDVGGYRMVWVGYTEHDPQKSVSPVAYAGHEAGYLNKIKISWADNELGRGPTGTAIRTGKPAYAIDTSEDPAFTPWRKEALERGYRSSIAVPLIINGRTLGTLSLYAGQTDAFNDEEVHLLTELANDLAYGVASLRAREERTRVEKALKESEQRYRSLIELSPEGIVVHSEGIIVFANAGSAEILRAASPEDLIGKPILDLVHPDYQAGSRERMQRMMEKGEKSPLVEEKLIRLDGTTVDVEVTGIPISFEGKPAVIVIGRDITERKMAEQNRLELEEHKRQFYRRTILAATEGKLEIAEREEIERLAGPPIESWQIRHKADPGLVRQGVTGIAEAAGMEESRLDDFMLCVGESTTNALKHAGGGTASLHRVTDGFMFVVSDQGPGIEALALPELALKRGYTTAASLGMGYKAIISLADKIYLATGPGGTTVGIEMGLHPSEKPPEIAVLPDTWRS